MQFADLGLDADILRAVEEAGYVSPTPIQAQAIPVIMAGHDVMGGAQTGTGKTAGFTLPILHQLVPSASTSTSPAKHPVRALILVPTRELAIQVLESVNIYSRYLPLRTVCLYGGVDIKPQMLALRNGVEIVVATPGRLLDHIEQKSIVLSQVQTLVLDEADRMLDMGFIPDIRRILSLLPKARQSLLFSATFSDEIKKLADDMLKTPQLIEVARRNMVSDTIAHLVYPVRSSAKRNLLVWLLQHKALEQQTLVFVGTKHGCSRLADYLSRHGIAADAIHGDKNQAMRSETLDAFKSGRVRVLVATDVAARGLDIDDLPLVVNYELPHTAEDYVHRIGRTGRAGRRGEAISLLSPEENFRLDEIEKLIKRTIPREHIPGFDGDDSQNPREMAGKELRRGARQDSKPSFSRTAKLPRQSKIAPDGFDFSKPYVPKISVTTANPAGIESLPRKAQKTRAFLLGGRKPG